MLLEVKGFPFLSRANSLLSIPFPAGICESRRVMGDVDNCTAGDYLIMENHCEI